MNSIKTLIIEDDPMLAQILQRFVYKVPNFVVVGACHNYEEAIEFLKTGPNLLLLDIYMNSNTACTKNGLDILKEIRGRNLDIDIIMITASKDMGIFSQCLRLGVIDFIIKPFEFSRLEETLKKYGALRRGLSDGKGDLWQKEIDSIALSKDIPQSAAGRTNLYYAALPKNIDRLTLDKIYACISRDETYTAAQISNLTSLSYATVKKYLDYMCENNMLSKCLQYSKVGRPLTVYNLT